MAHKDLKKQLEGIFADLEKPLKSATILELTEGGDAEKQEDEYQREDFFLTPKSPSKLLNRQYQQQLQKWNINTYSH